MSVGFRLKEPRLIPARFSEAACRHRQRIGAIVFHHGEYIVQVVGERKAHILDHTSWIHQYKLAY